MEKGENLNWIFSESKYAYIQKNKMLVFDLF